MPPSTLTSLRSGLLGRTASLSSQSLRILPFSLRLIRHFTPWRELTPVRDSARHAVCPPYPYGPEINYKQADGGLYGGIRPQSGNKISKGRNKGKTRRRWHPNVRIEELRSEALDRTFSIKVTAACMRTIRKCGGLDQYLLGEKPARIKELGLLGWQLRWKVVNSPLMQKEFRTQRRELNLGIGRKTTALGTSFETDWRRHKWLREEIEQEQREQWSSLRAKDERFQRHIKSRWEDAKPEDVVPPTFDAQAFEAVGPHRKSV